MNTQQFNAIMPHADAEKWLFALNGAMLEFGIISPANVAAFIAVIAVESDQLRVLEERLNYSSTALAKTWPNRYANGDGTPNRLALRIANNTQCIANNVYANRMGNGNEASGDGWAYRGVGPIQLTGKDAHNSVAAFFKIDPTTVHDWLLTPTGGCRSAAWFWVTHKCDQYAKTRDFDGVRDMVNIGHKTALIGDSIGYKMALSFYVLACAILGVA